MSGDKVKILIVGSPTGRCNLAMQAALTVIAANENIEVVHEPLESNINGSEFETVYLDELAEAKSLLDFAIKAQPEVCKDIHITPQHGEPRGRRKKGGRRMY